jgi:hypothetical protein
MRHFTTLIAVCFIAGMRAYGAEKAPVWLLGNDFHTSLVLRARDVPYRGEITGVNNADELAIGFGAAADYRGPSTPWTVLQAIFPNRGALHVVPICEPIGRRFPSSDLVVLWLDRGQLAKLVEEVNHSFAFTPDHRRVFLGRGHYADSRFYASSERFYFPYVCSEWVAIKLKRAGVPLFLPRAILSNS